MCLIKVFPVQITLNNSVNSVDFYTALDLTNTDQQYHIVYCSKRGEHLEFMIYDQYMFTRMCITMIYIRPIDIMIFMCECIYNYYYYV